MRKRAMTCLSLLLLAGCSATPKVTPIAVDGNMPDPKLPIPGVPFRVQADQVVRMYRWNVDKNVYEEVAATRAVAADLSRLYAIDVVGSSFASPSLHITENSDNTLKLMNVTSTASGAAASAVGTAVTGVAKAQSDRAGAQLTASAAVATAQKNWKDAINTLATDGAKVSPEMRAQLELAVTLTRQQLDAACQALAVAGLSCPPLP
jgi:hypothetical protein